MPTFSETIQFTTLNCGGCKVLFAMTTNAYDKLVAEKGTFWCPNGCQRHFTGGKTQKQLQQELDQKNEEIMRTLNRQHELERDVRQQQKKHMALRTKIFNGKCPCCDLVFENVFQHMHAQHADYVSEDLTLATLREMFGMTQSEVSREAEVNPTYISLFERGKTIPEYAKLRLENWIQQYVKRGVEEHVEVG